MKKEILVVALCGLMAGCNGSGNVENAKSDAGKAEVGVGVATEKEEVKEEEKEGEAKVKKCVPEGRYNEMVRMEEEKYPLSMNIEGERVSIYEARGDVGASFFGTFKKKEEGKIECEMEKSGEGKVSAEIEFADYGEGRVGMWIESGDEDLRRYCGRWIEMYSQNEGERTVWKAMYAKGAGSMLGLLKDVAVYRNDWGLMTLARYMEKPGGLENGDRAIVDYKNNYGYYENGDIGGIDEVKVWKTKKGGVLMGLAHTFETNCKVYFYRYDRESGTIERVGERMIDVNVGNKACDVLYHFEREFEYVQVELYGLDVVETYRWDGEGFVYVKN